MQVKSCTLWMYCPNNYYFIGVPRMTMNHFICSMIEVLSIQHHHKCIPCTHCEQQSVVVSEYRYNIIYRIIHVREMFETSQRASTDFMTCALYRIAPSNQPCMLGSLDQEMANILPVNISLFAQQ